MIKLSESTKNILSLSVDNHDGYDVSIFDSLANIFATTKGSVIMLPEFGSELYLLIDRRIDDEWLIDFRRYVKDALIFEPRVLLDNVEIISVDASIGSVKFRLNFADDSFFEGSLNGF